VKTLRILENQLEQRVYQIGDGGKRDKKKKRGNPEASPMAA
jgi:hypothetical protein